MSINDLDENNSVETEEKEQKKTKKSKRQKIYTVIISLVAVFLFILGSLTIYTSVNFEVAYFDDLSMAPTINKTITNKETEKTYTDNNFINTDGNLVEYGFISRKFSMDSLKRFDIVVLDNKMNGSSYSFEAYRIVGLPGEKVKLDYHGKLFINENEVIQPLEEKYLELNWNNKSDKKEEDLYFEKELSHDEFYLLKDNRYYTKNDSRTRGGYNYKQIYGVVKTINGTCTISGGKCVDRSWPLPRFI